MKTAKKAIVLVMCAALLVVGTVAGTMAYLTDQTATVENTFTVGKVDITLTETTGEKYKLVPGTTIDKNPTVAVTTGSEACWVFVKVAETPAVYDDEPEALLDVFIDYEIDDSWTQLSDNVYYLLCGKEEASSGKTYRVLDGDKVTVLTSVTAGTLNFKTAPTLSFTAYAVQFDGLADGEDSNTTTVDEAWEIITGTLVNAE